MTVRNVPVSQEVRERDAIPRDPGKVGIGKLLANKVSAARFLQMPVNHPRDPLDLLAITVNRRLNLLEGCQYCSLCSSNVSDFGYRPRDGTS
jgi:hypothetical protein